MTDSQTAPTIPADLIYSGKVRDTYRISDELLLMVASDRLSAFDVILPTPIPGKGIVLTQLSRFWFDQLGDLLPNHLSQTPLGQFGVGSSSYR